MNRIVTSILMIFTISTASAQSKKEKVANLTHKVDSLTEVIAYEREVIEKRIDEIAIEIKAFQNQLNELYLSNDSLNTQLFQERDKTLLLGKQYSLIRDSLEILKQQIAELNRINSLNALRDSNEFEPFLSDFLSTVYSEKNIDSLIYMSSPLIMDFVNEKVGFGRFWNMGVSCNLYGSDCFGYHFYDDYFGETQPNTSNLSFFENQKPEEGFCDEATSPNGIYYRQVTDLPEDYDIYIEEYVPSPLMLKQLRKMVVQVQSDLWIAKTLYFVELDNKWFLLYVNDCDCGA
ncbi:MAG: hypothetical protein ACI8SE_000746 [Bacteroidia bacterium]|jgi:hypothetical protein